MLVVAAVAVIVEGVIHRGRPAIVASIATQVMSAVAAILADRDRDHAGHVRRVVRCRRRSHEATTARDRDRPQGSVPTSTSSCSTRIQAIAPQRARPSFDAEAFPNALTARGFDVDRDTHSNYLMTPADAGIDAVDASPRSTSRRSTRRTDLARQRLVPGSQGPRIGAGVRGPSRAGLRGRRRRRRIRATPQLRRVDRFFEQPGPQELETHPHEVQAGSRDSSKRSHRRRHGGTLARRSRARRSTMAAAARAERTGPARASSSSTCRRRIRRGSSRRTGRRGSRRRSRSAASRR